MTVLNWRGIFVVLGGIAILLILLARWKLHETLPEVRRHLYCNNSTVCRRRRLASALRRTTLGW